MPNLDARGAIAAVAIWLATALVPAAADIDYDPRRAEALKRCDEPRHHGRVDAARQCLTPLLRSTDPLVRAEAAFALGDLRTANDLFRDAVAANPQAVLPRVRWGRLFQAAGQHQDALSLYQEALEIDAEDVAAQVAMARLAVEQLQGDATSEIESLLAAHPDLIEAHLLAAGIALEGGELDDAVREAQRAQQLAVQQRQPPLEALTLLAAVEVARNRDPAAYVRQVLEYNPRYGELFLALGHYEDMRRRYGEANTWFRRAVEVQPELWAAQRELGVNLMRLGRIEEARPYLEAAYNGDPFNTTTVNMLRLIDTLKNFEVVHVAQPALNLQLHRDEVAALSPYVEQITRAGVADFSRRYGYTPTDPITIEIYPNHDDFTVRSLGVPGVGVLGVTFGHVVAMDSPTGRKSGEFHWGSTLWHELAHVFTVSASEHRSPRWLGEGLSVYEEWTSGPTPGVAITPSTLDKFAEDAFLPVATLDNGFMRPTYDGQIQVSYEQAGLMCFFAAQRWGFPKLAQYLRSFRDPNVTTESGIRTVFQVAPEEFDRQFEAFVRERFASYLADPKRWADLMRRSHQMLESRNWSAAREAAQAAILMLPEYTAGGSAYEVLAAAEEGAGNAAAATTALLAWRKAGGWDPATLRKLASLLLASSRNAEAAEVLAAVNYADPFASEGHDQLGRLLITLNRGDDALREYQVLLALKPLDTAAANYGLASAYRLTGDTAQARRHLLESLETAPNYRPAQRMLLEMTGDRTQ